MERLNTAETKKNAVENLLDGFEDLVETKTELTVQDREELASQIKTPEDLTSGIVRLRDKANDYKSRAEECAKKIKEWQESKKGWEAKSKNLMDTLQLIMKRLAFPKDTLKADGVKLTVTTKTVLEVDEDWILGQYQALVEEMQHSLPEYIKVSLSVDKTKLFNHVKNDDTMLLSNPMEIHTKESLTTSIK